MTANGALEIDISGQMLQDLEALTDNVQYGSFLKYLAALLAKNRERLEKPELTALETDLLRGENRRLNRLIQLRPSLLSSKKAATA